MTRGWDKRLVHHRRSMCCGRSGSKDTPKAWRPWSTSASSPTIPMGGKKKKGDPYPPIMSSHIEPESIGRTWSSCKAPSNEPACNLNGPKSPSAVPGVFESSRPAGAAPTLENTPPNYTCSNMMKRFCFSTPRLFCGNSTTR